MRTIIKINDTYDNNDRTQFSRVATRPCLNSGFDARLRISRVFTDWTFDILSRGIRGRLRGGWNERTRNSHDSHANGIAAKAILRRNSTRIRRKDRCLWKQRSLFPDAASITMLRYFVIRIAVVSFQQLALINKLSSKRLEAFRQSAALNHRRLDATSGNRDSGFTSAAIETITTGRRFASSDRIAERIEAWRILFVRPTKRLLRLRSGAGIEISTRLAQRTHSNCVPFPRSTDPRERGLRNARFRSRDSSP